LDVLRDSGPCGGDVLPDSFEEGFEKVEAGKKERKSFERGVKESFGGG
jgi:hypothetical protein